MKTIRNNRSVTYPASLWYPSPRIRLFDSRFATSVIEFSFVNPVNVRDHLEVTREKAKCNHKEIPPVTTASEDEQQRAPC